MREYGHAFSLPLRGIQLPMRNGVSASVVSVPQGAPHLLDFLAQRMPGISRSQWAERLAQGLRALAHAQDGLVEAFEVQGAKAFAVAVQWHPEWRTGESAFYSALFGAFGEACRAHRAARL